MANTFEFNPFTGTLDLVGSGGGGSGDVTGPASSTNNNLVAFDGTTGKLIKDSGVATSALVTASSTTTFTNKTFDADGTGNSITNIENADIKAAAAIAVNKLAALTASRAVVTDASGFITQATTTATEIGYVNGVTSAIQTQLDGKQPTGSYLTASSTATLTNKTFDADGTGNSITNIENADIKAAAAIALNKLAATTASRALVSDSSGFVTAATTTSTEIGYVNGVTSAIQTQLDAKQSTKTYAVFTPSLNQPPASTYATPSTRNSIAILQFDDATSENAIFVGILPEGANVSSGLKVIIKWTAATATTGNCVWEASFMALDATTDIDSDSFDTATSATTAAPGTSGYTTTTTITCTTIDSLVAGVAYRLKILRNGGSGSDTMTGDAEVHSVELRSAV